MYIIETTPIKRGVGRESLTYFYKDPVAPGSIVAIPLRGKLADGLVTKCSHLDEEKLEIKSKGFALKKIMKIKAGPVFLPSFIDACEDTANFFAGTTGAVISNLTPSNILENLTKLSPKHEGITRSSDGTLPEHWIVQDEDNDRLSTYKSLIREEFAKDHSVFFCLPTGAEVRKAYAALEKGIGPYTYAFHGNMDKREMLELWQKAVSEKHPILIIGTGGFLSLPRTDIGLFIVDKENSRHYKSQTRPYIDVRRFAEILATKIKAKLVFGDIALRVETIYRFRKSELSGVLPPKFKYLSSARSTLVDMKSYKIEEKEDYIFLSKEIRNLIEKNKEGNEHMVVFSARRGLSPTTVCLDCGEIVKCGNCATPTVLHRSGSKNIYLCHRCNNIESPEKRCGICNSWRLSAFGAGIETIEEEIERLFPDQTVLRIDSDTVKNEKKLLGLIEKWKNSPGSILLCTELALPYIDNAETVAITSLDSLFSVPDFRINEKVLGLILQLRAIAIKNFLIQTRQPNQPSVKAGISGNLLDFYKSEIDEREEFGYPPFYQFIKISLIGDKGVIIKEMKEVTPIFDDYELDIYPALSGSRKGKSVLNALLRLKNDEWPSERLALKLKDLSPKFIVKVDPESLL